MAHRLYRLRQRIIKYRAGGEKGQARLRNIVDNHKLTTEQKIRLINKQKIPKSYKQALANRLEDDDRFRKAEMAFKRMDKR